MGVATPIQQQLCPQWDAASYTAQSWAASGLMISMTDHTVTLVSDMALHSFQVESIAGGAPALLCCAMHLDAQGSRVGVQLNHRLQQALELLSLDTC
jgi:hypothetical protein